MCANGTLPPKFGQLLLRRCIEPRDGCDVRKSRALIGYRASRVALSR